MSRVTRPMQKHPTHVIDEQAVRIFKDALPSEQWTVYDIQPDYGKDHKVELVEGGEHTGLSFWVQIKGQKKVKKLKDGTISFKLETKYLDYHAKLLVPVFLIVVDVNKRVGYWVFTQEYLRTQLRNVAWRDQESIQIRIPESNTLSEHGALCVAVKQAVRYLTRLTFDADIKAEKRRLEALDPRFSVEITSTSNGRHYQLHAEEQIPIDFAYKDGNPHSGKIEEMLDRGVPIAFRQGEIVVSGSPLFKVLLESTGSRDLHLQFNTAIEGHANLLRVDEFDGVKAKIDAIPCKLICGRREARIEAKLPYDLIGLSTTIAYDLTGDRQMSLPIDLSAWRGRRLMELPFFDQLTALLVGFGPDDRLDFECFGHGQRVLTGTMNFEETRPYLGLSLVIEMLGKARAIAKRRSLSPTVPEDFGAGSFMSEIQTLYDITIGEGERKPTPSARVRVTVLKGGVKKFLADVGDSAASGPLNLYGEGSFPFFGESVHVSNLERVVTNMRLVNTQQLLKAQLVRSSRRKEIELNWKATEATETILRERSMEPEVPDRKKSKAG